jgi:hypothetical protein
MNLLSAVAAGLSLTIQFTSFLSPFAKAENTSGAGLQTEDNFREIFVTAGYSAAFGAALGTAILPFFPSQSFSNLRYVAAGASLGFIIGSGFAFYNLSNGGLSINPEPYGDDVQDEQGEQLDENAQTFPKEPIPSGALFVGSNGRWGFSSPAIGPMENGAMVQVLNLRF